MEGNIKLDELIGFLKDIPEDCPVKVDYDSCHTEYPTGIKFQGDTVAYIVGGRQAITAGELLSHIEKKMDSLEYFPAYCCSVFSECREDGKMYIASCLDRIYELDPDTREARIFCEVLDEANGR